MVDALYRLQLISTFIIICFQLKPQEAEFLAVNTNAALSTFEKVSENIGKDIYRSAIMRLIHLSHGVQWHIN